MLYVPSWFQGVIGQPGHVPMFFQILHEQMKPYTLEGKDMVLSFSSQWPWDRVQNLAHSSIIEQNNTKQYATV